MATEQTSGRPSGAVAEVKDKGEELVSSTQEQLSTKAHELGEDVSFQVREQLDQRSTQAGEQVQAMSHALQSRRIRCLRISSALPDAVRG